MIGPEWQDNTPKRIFTLPKGMQPTAENIAMLAGKMSGKADTLGVIFGFGEGAPVYAKGVKRPEKVRRFQAWKKIARTKQPTFLFAIGLRFYIASSLDNAEAVRKLAAELKAEGHIHTYDWTTHGSVFKVDASRADNIAVMAKTAHAEEEGVATADVVIVLLPGGKGTHVELGMALAMKKPIVIASDVDPYYGGPQHNGGRAFPCAFWYHQLVQHVEPTAVVAAVREMTIELRRQKAVKHQECSWTSSILEGLNGLLSTESNLPSDGFDVGTL